MSDCVLVSQVNLQCFITFSQSIFLNVVSGINLKETAGDLAVAAAICSRYPLFFCIVYPFYKAYRKFQELQFVPKLGNGLARGAHLAPI